MALAIDGSTPAIVTGSGTITTATFTPPDNSVLVIKFSGNSVQGSNPGAPTVTDSLGVHLVYTLSDWRSRADNAAIESQCAIWSAVVGTGAAMTVSVTNNAANFRDGAVCVEVWTGADTSTPTGAHGKNGSTSASSISQSYTASATGGQGSLVTADWDMKGAQTAGSGCTVEGSADVNAAFSYGFATRTFNDDGLGAPNSLNVSLPGSSTNLTWCWLEILPLVGDPGYLDPPPFIANYPPGFFAPNGRLVPWFGTADVPAVVPGLFIDASSPTIVTNNVGATATITTASFTPPTGSLLLVRWSGNSASGVNPGTPTVTDNLGGHLTYTLSDWQSRADGAPNSEGQTAIWTAPVVSSAAMTVTVTSGVATSFKQSALSVTVLTGQDPTTPVGAHGKSHTSSASLIIQGYTAQATGAQGFISVCDWDTLGAETAGTGCTVAGFADGSGSVGTSISYGFLRRSLADDVNTVTNNLNVTIPGTSTNLGWTYIEINPAPAAGNTNAPAGAAEVAVTAGDSTTAADVGADQALVAVTGTDSVAAVSVAAEAATVSAAATDSSTTLTAGADQAVVAATATDPVASVSASAEAAPVGVAGLDPTVSTTGGTNAPAGAAEVAVTATDPSTAVTVNADVAVVGVAQSDPVASVAVSADVAIAATAAIDPQAGTVGVATVAATAETPSTTVTVNADVATVGITQSDPTASVAPAPGVATVGTAQSDPTDLVAAQADQALVAVTATDPTTANPDAAPVGVAALDPTVSTANATNAPADVATVGVVAEDPSTTGTVNADQALVAATGTDSAASVAGSAEAAAVNAAATDSSTAVAAGAGVAVAAATAGDSTVATSSNVLPTEALVGVAALDPTVVVAVSAGVAAPAVAALDSTVVLGTSTNAGVATVGVTVDNVSLATQANAEAAVVLAAALGPTVLAPPTVTPRPDTGITPRPDTGVTSRPGTGVTGNWDIPHQSHGSSGRTTTTRPDTGTTTRP